MRKALSAAVAAFSLLSVLLPVSAAGIAANAPSDTQTMLRALVIMLGIAAIMLILSIIVAATRPFSRRKSAFNPVAACILYLATIVQIGFLVFSFLIYNNALSQDPPQLDASTVIPDATEPDTATDPAPSETEASPTEPEETVPPTTEDPKLSFQPMSTDSSNPENWNITWDIMVNDEIVESYQREEPITFDQDPETYFSLPGIATFRGNNYRNSASYGTADVTEAKLTKIWNKHVGFLETAEWIGCGWTGQPLIVQWDEETKAIMNLYEDKKAKENLVEVIYAKLDGYIHFYDLEDGSATRDAIYMGMAFKGAGALDPRGYPVLYLGSGLQNYGKNPRMYAISLIDGKVLYEYGFNETFSLRTWCAFDSSPLVDVETDTLIWPGENGVLYTIKLNSSYDKAAGTFTLDPEVQVKSRYTSTYSVDENRYLGYEPSASIVNNYMFISENGGLFQCIDLNTMELIWAQDTKDDSNSSPLFDWGEDGNGYIYTAPSLHWTQDDHHGEIPIYKLNAATGEIEWTHIMDCVTYDGCSGGVQSSPVLGKEGSNIEGMIFYSVGRCPGPWVGQLVALDKETGELIWQTETDNYTWSSPIAVYDEEGKAYLFLADASGNCCLYDGATGELLDTLDLNQTIEASPVAFNDMIIMGTREGVYGIKIS